MRYIAPSNIALVKYMGKSDPSQNLPANPSLSMTLNDLKTVLILRETDETRWNEDGFEGLEVPKLSEKGWQKIQRHLDFLWKSSETFFSQFDLKRREKRPFFEIQSANTFPAGAGIASSASSFAALTLGVLHQYSKDPDEFQKYFESEDPGHQEFRRLMASLSRHGSGSSCRSFEGPWVKWENDRVSAIPSPFSAVSDLVLVVDDAPKKVSSSEAHLRVQTSPLWQGRAERAIDRTLELEEALKGGNWKLISELAWAETWEMHSLFHTAKEPFSYWNPSSVEILKSLSQDLQSDRPPIVTMDAGPNVHVLVPETEADHWEKELKRRFPGAQLLRDHAGQGPQIISL